MVGRLDHSNRAHNEGNRQRFLGNIFLRGPPVPDGTIWLDLSGHDRVRPASTDNTSTTDNGGVRMYFQLENRKKPKGTNSDDQSFVRVDYRKHTVRM